MSGGVRAQDRHGELGPDDGALQAELGDDRTRSDDEAGGSRGQDRGRRVPGRREARADRDHGPDTGQGDGGRVWAPSTRSRSARPEFQGPSFHVLAGSANFLFRAMLGGSPGGTVSLANSFPQLAQQLFGYGRARDEVNGVPLQNRVSRINAAISGAYGVAGVKAAMTLAGFRGGIPRRPLLPLDPGQVAGLKALLAAEGLLP